MTTSPCGCDPQFFGPSIASCGGSTVFAFMALLQTYLTNTCDISQICERVEPLTSVTNKSFDFVVIGGGSAGSVVAARLSEVHNWNVLLVEQGHDEPVGSQVPGQVGTFLSGPNSINRIFKTAPEPQSCQANKGCSWPCGKVLGGTSVLNGMMFVRGTPADYERWVKLGAEGWSYKDNLPYFIMSENNRETGTLVDANEHGTGGPIPVSRFPYQPPLAWDVLAAAEALGYGVSNDLSGKKVAGLSVAQMNNDNGVRVSSARAYLRPNRHRKNLHIMLNTTATRIIVKNVNGVKRATGVELLYNGKRITVSVTKEVIVSAGAVQSPQVLLLSGIGPKNVLSNVGIKQVHELPGVGQNLHNHVTFTISYNLTKVPNEPLLNWTTALDYITRRQGPLSSTAMSQVTARLPSKMAPAKDDPDVQLFFSGFGASCAKSCSDSTAPGSFKTLSISPVNLHPKSRGNITLASSDPLADPIIHPNYLAEEEDLERLLEALRIAQTIGNSTILRDKYGSVAIVEDYAHCSSNEVFDSDDYWRCALRYQTEPENHQAGSCKMGNSTDPLAVVNPQLQLYGIDNIRVADASVMPVVVSGNTHATIVMIGERAADNIKKKYHTC